MDPFREWAWKQYDHCARTVPGTDECKAAWRIHLAAGAVMAGLRTAERPSQAQSQAKQPTIIVAASDMDTATFALHFSKRHKDSLGDKAELPADISFDIEQMYRAFHNRLHGLRKYRHDHEPDKPEVGIDRAIECLFENHDWGWKQLAGVSALVAVFPDGQISVKPGNGRVIFHFTEIDEATDCLLDFPTA
jgi:hypothetical protein